MAMYFLLDLVAFTARIFDTREMIEIGDSVTSRDGKFSGRVLGRHGGGAFTYQSLPEDLNIAVFAVLSDDTGEVRHFTRAGLLLTDA